MKDMKIFERVLNLIKKTGDRVIVVNPDSDSSCVVMSLDDYEKMVEGEPGRADLTVRETKDKMEKINQDIALLREEAQKNENPVPNLIEEVKPTDSNEETAESQFYFEPVE